MNAARNPLSSGVLLNYGDVDAKAPAISIALTVRAWTVACPTYID